MYTQKKVQEMKKMDRPANGMHRVNGIRSNLAATVPLGYLLGGGSQVLTCVDFHHQILAPPPYRKGPKHIASAEQSDQPKKFRSNLAATVPLGYLLGVDTTSKFHCAVSKVRNKTINSRRTDM